jgi:DNA polymerase-3 subunit epsilon
MDDRLQELRVLALDCQAGGATPAHGDLLELGWAVCSAATGIDALVSHWIVPRTERPVPRAVRELTGWTKDCIASALDDRVAWTALRDSVRSLVGNDASPAPVVIHYARYELPFLHDLHQRLGAEDAFPFDVVCVHAIAARLFPDLPRRNIRALAGHLGHSPELVRRSAGHVEATAFIWKSLVPLLEARGVTTWAELVAWLDSTSPSVRPKTRRFPLAPERRRSLPDGPGIYRFLRRSGDILYVGKATSLKKRVASHFKSSGPTTERGLELLTQVHDIQHVQTSSILEAAILETDEIKRLDPPYNVHLRSGERRAWFASRDLESAMPAPDDDHRAGPLPSERALTSFSALVALAGGAAATPGLIARALAVPRTIQPEIPLFEAGWSVFRTTHLDAIEGPALPRMLGAALTLWRQRGYGEPEAPADAAEGDTWDLARVQRRLERALVNGGLLLRRARVLTLLADATVAFRERGMERARALVVVGGQIVETYDLESIEQVDTGRSARPRSLRERRLAFDARAYDRLRVLVTELCRVGDDGGEVALVVGKHRLVGERFARLIRFVSSGP